LPVEYITPEEMREAEARAVESGMTVEEMMENAGRAVADTVAEWCNPRGSIVVVCGSGNNGGDGFVAARHLSKRFKASVVLLARPDAIRTLEARRNWDRLAAVGVKTIIADSVDEVRGLGRVLDDAEVIVAAILGTGIKGEVREPLATAMDLINRSKAKKVAVDVPSGLDPGTGAVSRHTVRADITVTLHRPKVGLRGRDEYAGQVVVAPIGIGE
jgi:hydroxyethylthiazole kinase-like uncharacterized protein yjeF